ncbi:uncharacterized protein LOC112084511 [Eutrema salsugineum]|uniref:uncharacterized protein LOC112084511 n=1 Tax=Eutrema salsugineum TaxID=72664 RepID=UPI000CECF9D6|nr:uncharacterized protein LOC112084511 [Eutrema salsugineum]
MAYEGWWCYTDGSWKDTYLLTGLGWYFFKEDATERIMGTQNVRRSLTPLHAEIEALIWAMHCMLENQKMEVAFATDCSELVKMVSTPEEWPAFDLHLEEIRKMKDKFSFFLISHIPRAKNSKADNLARSARVYPQDVIYVNSVLPVWIAKPF